MTLGELVLQEEYARRKAHAAQASDRVGVLIELPSDGGAPVTCDLVACAHCSYVWQWIEGSGRRRGRCGICGGLVCGRPCCEKLACTHLEQRLENMESGRALDYKPIRVSTAGLIVPEF